MFRNNFNNQNLGRIVDLEVIYTGCGGECYGIPITPNMTLRQVLDILVSNCGEGGGGGSKWYSGDTVPTFPANDGDYYLQSNGIVWTYDSVEGWEETDINLKGISWGDITGNVADQTDLVDYINNRIQLLMDETLSNLAGQALSYDEVTKKMNLGTVFSDVLRLILFNQSDQQAYFGFDNGSGIPDNTKPTITISTSEIQMTVGTVSLAIQQGNFQITESSTGSTIILSTNGVVLQGESVSISGNSEVGLTGNSVSIQVAPAGSLNIIGKSTISGNLTWASSGVGPVLRDTTNGNNYRLQVVNGVLGVVVQP